MKVKNASLIFDKTPRTKVPLLPPPVQCPEMHSSTESKPQRSRLPSAILTQLPIISCPQIPKSAHFYKQNIYSMFLRFFWIEDCRMKPGDASQNAPGKAVKDDQVMPSPCQ